MNDHNSLVTRTSSDGLNREVTGYTYFKASTPKYFFVAIANCDPDCGCDYISVQSDGGDITNCTNSVGRNCDGPLMLEYDFVFTNGKDPGVKHFSADEIGTLELCIVYLVLYTLLVIAGHMGVKKKLQKQVRESASKMSGIFCNLTPRSHNLPPRLAEQIPLHSSTAYILRLLPVDFAAVSIFAHKFVRRKWCRVY